MSAQAFFSSSTLQLTNSLMSGWSALRTTIFAARRVLPPDLMTPAEASAAFMKESGPDAVPPADSFSLFERSVDRLTPEPEPPLKIIPSLRYQPRIDSIESSTLRMKHAEHCGFASMPTLKYTGLLNEAFWVSRRWRSSARKVSRASELGKYACFSPHPAMVSTTRSTSCRTE